MAITQQVFVGELSDCALARIQACRGVKLETIRFGGCSITGAWLTPKSVRKIWDICLRAGEIERDSNQGFRAFRRSPIMLVEIDPREMVNVFGVAAPPCKAQQPTAQTI